MSEEEQEGQEEGEEQEQGDEPEGEEDTEPQDNQEFNPINFKDERTSTHVVGEPRDIKSRIRTRFMFLLIEERKFKYFVILIAFLVVFASTFTLKLHERLALAFMVAMVIYIFWIHVIIPEEEKPLMREGYVITWIDKFSHFPFVRREYNMKIVYCQFAIYPDGSVESIPDTEFLGAYTLDIKNHIPFNPLVDMHLKKHFEKFSGQEIPYADGTDKYMSPQYVKYRRIARAIQSGTPMAVKKTTHWLHGG